MEEPNLPAAPKGTGTTYVDVALIILVVVVMLMAFSAATRPLAIGIGIGVSWVAGILVLLVYMIDQFAKRDKSTGDSDFSSWFPAEEKAFVGHEKRMRAVASRASLMGFGIAGLLFVVGMGVTLGMYTPCTQFCDHPPGGCKTEKQISDFKASCESSCAKLESTPGLSMLKRKSADNIKDTTMQPASGTEFVQALSACAFSGGLGNVCEEVTKKAITYGLWCAETP